MWLFVYNADGNMSSKWIDAAHKLISPQTYACHLCSITHGTFREKKAWKAFRESHEHEFQFIYKDQFLKRYPMLSIELPAIFFLPNESEPPQLKITAKDLSQWSDPEELINNLEQLMSKRSH